jgi:hypothetical protein
LIELVLVSNVFLVVIAVVSIASMPLTVPVLTPVTSYYKLNTGSLVASQDAPLSAFSHIANNFICTFFILT